MASVKLTRMPGVGRQTKFQAEFLRSPSHLPTPPQLSAKEQLELRPGVRGFVPRGTDLNAPRKS